MAVTVKQEVAALYSAIFNRAPDQAGLEFWVNAIEGGDSLVQAAEGFTQHPVFAETYAGMSDSQFVQQLYVNILGGAGDANGIAFWTEKLASGVSKGQVVAEFVQGALSIDLDALLASGELSQAEYDAAVVRQNSITNKADAGVYFADTFGAASNLSASTDTTTKEGLESDPVYLASQAAIAGVTNDAATLAAAKAAIDAAEAPTDLLVAPAFTLTEALAIIAEGGELPEGYELADATADLGALAIADVAAAQQVAADIVAGAANAAELELAATYTIADTLANVLAADAAVLAAAGSYSLTDAAGALGELTEAQVAVVLGAANAEDFTYTAAFTLTGGLEDLAAAQKAKADFLAELELDTNLDGTVDVEAGDADDGDVTTFFDSSITNALFTGVNDLTSAAVGDISKDRSDAYNNAVIDEQKALNDKAVSDKLKVVNEVTGLKAAVDAIEPAQDGVEAAIDAQVATYVTVAGAEVAFETADNGAAAITLNYGSVTSGEYTTSASNVANLQAGNKLVIDGSGNAVIEVNAKGEIVVATAYAGKAQADALLAAVKADVAAIQELLSAREALAEALAGVLHLEGANKLVGTELVTVSDANGSGPSSFTGDLYVKAGKVYVATDSGGTSTSETVNFYLVSELSVSIAANGTLSVNVAIDSTTPDDTGTYDDSASATIDDVLAAKSYTVVDSTKTLSFSAAQLDASAFVDTAVAGYVDAGFATEAPKSDAYIDALDTQSDFVKAVETYLEAKALVADLNAFTDAVTEARAALTDSVEDGGLGVNLLEGAQNFTLANDVYLFSETDSASVSLAKFGASGEDKIFFGEDFSLVALGDEVIGDNVGSSSALEIFWEQIGTSVKLYVETETFGGNSSGTDEIVEITLTGVNAANVTFADGYLSAGTAA